jgi:hypothetical protein
MNDPSGLGVRFLQISDLRFEEPLPLDEEMPVSLRSELLQAKRTALKKIVSLAVERRFDFVLFTGRILATTKASPGLLRAFCEELAGLGEQGIPIYWHTARGEKTWPKWLNLPPGCHLVKGPTVVRTGQGTPLLVFVPFRYWMPGPHGRKEKTARSEQARPRGLPVVVLAGRVGKAELQQAMELRPAAYWALCEGNRRQLVHAGQIAHCPGPIQPENENQCGSHGCTEVHIPARQSAKILWHPADVVRFVKIHLHYEEFPSLEKLQEDAEKQRDRIRKAWPDRIVLATWVIHLLIDSSGSDNSWKKLEHRLADEFRRLCNHRLGTETPPLWSLAVRICPHIRLGRVFPRSFLATFLEEAKKPDLLARAISQTEKQLDGEWTKDHIEGRVLADLLKAMKKRKLARLAAWEGLRQLASKGASS